MANIGADEPILFFGCGIKGGVAQPGCFFIVVVVAPLGKVVCEFKSGGVCIGVLEVDDNELFVCVCG